MTFLCKKFIVDKISKNAYIFVRKKSFLLA